MQKKGGRERVMGKKRKDVGVLDSVTEDDYSAFVIWQSTSYSLGKSKHAS